MDDVRFSIVIPTRNRYETLAFCLKTCLQQSFDSYEIIVSDNSDEIESIETKKTVDKINSKKLKYFRPSTVLSMTANYEFALSKSTGQYVVCMGDDDGLIPDSLSYVNGLIIRFDAQVVKSPIVIYHWKNALQNPNIIGLPYPTPIIKIDSLSILKRVCHFELGYFNLPMIYYSFVCRKVIDKVIALQGSFFGNAASIDMYSGLVVAYHTTDYILSDSPFIVAGLSGKSNGASEVKSLQTDISKEHYAKTGLSQMYKTYQVPQLPNYNLQLLSLLELTKFKKNFKLTDDEFEISTKKVMLKFLSKKSILDNMNNLALAECFREYDIYKEDILSTEMDFLAKQIFFPFLEENDVQMVRHTFINPDLFHIDNVFDAAIVVRKILDGYENVKPIPISIPKKANEISLDNHLPFVRKYYKRMRRAGKILLRGYE